METSELENQVYELEIRVERLRVLYDQYFTGLEKLEPAVARKDVERRLEILRRIQIRNTGLRFRFQVMVQRYNTYQTYWLRICRQIENGTYKRHVLRAKARFGDLTAPDPKELAEDVDLDDLGAGAPAAAEAPRADRSAAAASAPRAMKAAEATRALEDLAASMGDLGSELDDAFDRMNAGPEPPPSRAARASAPRGDTFGQIDEPDLLGPGPPSSGGFGRIDAAPPSGPVPSTPGGAPRDAATISATGKKIVIARRGPAASSPDLVSPRAPAPSSPDAGQAPRPPTANASPAARPAGAPNASPAARAPAPTSPNANPAARPPAPSSPNAGPASSVGRAGPGPSGAAALAEERVRQIYARYVSAKRANGESTAAVTFEALAQSLRDSSARLRERVGADKHIDFEVATKDGKTVLKPVVK